MKKRSLSVLAIKQFHQIPIQSQANFSNKSNIFRYKSHIIMFSNHLSLCVFGNTDYKMIRQVFQSKCSVVDSLLA